MKKLIVISCAVAACGAVITGCKSIRFERVERVPVADGTNVVATTEKIVRGEYYAYGIENNLEGLEIAATPTNGVAVKINRVSYDMSKQHAEIIDKSLTGAANLAAKIGAAIATSGAAPSADAIAALVKKFTAAGGNVDKANVECIDGSCTISDGAITCTDGSCTL